MREMAWPSARRSDRTLIDKPCLKVSALTGRGSTLVSGDIGAAVQALAYSTTGAPA